MSTFYHARSEGEVGSRWLRPASQALDADELLTVEPVPLSRAIQMCTRGELRDAKSMCALLLAERRLS